MKRTIFDHDRTRILTPEPGDNLSLPVDGPYSDRALALSCSHDVVMLHPLDYPHADWIVRHQKRVGLNPAGLIMRKIPYTQITDFKNYNLSTFIFDEVTNQARPDRRRLEITRSLDSKNEFIKLCGHHKVEVPQTWCYDSKDQLTSMKHLTFPNYLKISTSITGKGVFRCENKLELIEYLEKISSKIKFQIQEDLISKHRVITFLNLQYFERDEKANRLLLTDQVLDGNVHIGNSFSPAATSKYSGAWLVVDSLAKHAVKCGMKGVFAFDVAVCSRENGEIYHLPVECNPRPNGSSYSTAVVDRLLGGNSSWTAKAVKTKFRKLDDIDLGDLEFNSKRGNGVVVHIGATITKGKLGITFIGQPHIQSELEHKLSAILQ